MKKILYFLTAVAMLVMFGCTGDTTSTSLTNPNPNPYNPKGTVSGVLRDAVTQVPLAGAVVHIMDRQATTDATGIFTIYNVPALNGTGNEPSNGNAPYPVVIDMAAVNTAIKTGAKYPAIAYSSVNVTYTSLGETSGAGGVGTNHDTPTDGFVANIMPTVGRLDAAIKMQVVTPSLANVPDGTTVNIYDIVGSNNTTSGAGGTPGHLIQTASTVGGFVTFSALEAKQLFVVKAFTADGKSEGWYGLYTISSGNAVPTGQVTPVIIAAPSDGLTDVYAVQGGQSTDSTAVGPLANLYNNALVVGTVDNVAPFVIGTSISPLQDVTIPTSGTITLTYTFSEPIKQNTYATATTAATAALGGLYKDIAVNFLGPKSGNIAYSLAWSTDGTQLTVSIPNAVAASRYDVNLAGALGSVNKLVDLAGNAALVTAAADVTFTTAGGFNVGAPTIVATNPVTVSWTPVTNAVGYFVIITPSITGTPVTVPLAGAANTSLNIQSLPPGTLFVGYNPAAPFANAVTYSVVVTTLNASASQSAPSNSVTLTDAAVVPGAPTALAFAAVPAGTQPTVLNWTAASGPVADHYTVYVQTLQDAVPLGPYTAIGTNTLPTFAFGTPPFANGQHKITYNIKVTASDAYGTESAASNVVGDSDVVAPLAAVTAGRPTAPIAISTTVNGTLTVLFNKEMVYADIINPASWGFAPAGATTATVTYTFGPGISYGTPALTATVPYSIVTNATGTIAAGVINVTCAAKSVGGGLAVAASF
ncbi:MAG TPA: fibronectin type III domain-containing protein [Geobacteraceae bacterium]